MPMDHPCEILKEVELAGPKREVVKPKMQPNLDERFRQLERAPELSNQELAMQLCKLKETIEALLDIIANAATEDNKREAYSHQQELDRQ
uniref:Uncharacterized protein n=1 Tax=Romanomermis culicivorax TaxID=13658 RepID=A0A915J701_ROMCU